MSQADAAPASIRSSAAVRRPLHTLREALQLFRSVADGSAKRRLLVAPASVASGAMLAALAPIALKLVINSLAQGWRGAEPRSRQRGSHRGELTFEHVTFSYRERQAVLQDVSFTVPAGKTVAVVGVSATGKSSLIRLLFRLYEPDAGRILLDGTPIRDLSLSAVRQAIAVVPQDTVLFHDSIASNIGFGRAGASLVDIQEAARIANLHEFIARLPDGYDTVVGERGLKLSGGERQRIAIARAALKKPRIFVFDEATASLDARTEREILRSLLEVSARSTTLVIAHRLSSVVHADRIIVLDRGVVLEQGTHAELRARNGAYEALWRARQGAVSQREELPIPAAHG